MILEVKNLTKSFGCVTAVKNFSFELGKSEILGLIGPNGAGKTTLFNLLSGVIKADSGRITFLGHDITNMPPYKICKLGLARTHQIPRPYGKLTVLENVMIGSLFGPGNDIKTAREKSLKLLNLVGLQNKEAVPIGGLTAFEIKMLEIARALAAEPKLLLLDEPFAGLNPVEIDNCKELVKKVRDGGVSVMLVEHNMRAIRGTVDRVLVMHQGEKIAEGTFEEIAKNPEVIDAYLGSLPVS
ncbi:ABC transporter ATP-binding protein [Candidatus Bathyarchaeota archaeon]|nr:ABC transporter ATP-binding protein [Candidatus Bathyarchaeota archaeon]